MDYDHYDNLARIAYAAYGKTTDYKNYQGLPMPEFDALTDKIKLAWRNVGEAIETKTAAAIGKEYR